MVRVLLSVVALLGGLVGLAPPATASAVDDWRGDRDAMPSSYAWLGDFVPDYDYEILVVRGLTPAQVRRTLGPVRRQAPDMTPDRAERWVMDRFGESGDNLPPLALVGRRGPAVVVYLPAWILGEETVARLSRRGEVVHFVTTIELDTYVTVARRGRVVRTFDAGFRPPRDGALPEEDGLDWGRRDQNIWATAWAFSERVTGIHLSQEWFEGRHQAYVFHGRVW